VPELVSRKIGIKNENFSAQIDIFKKKPSLQGKFTILKSKFFPAKISFSKIPGSVKAFNFLLKISPVKINEKNSCP
jgi:hypothetical protein